MTSRVFQYGNLPPVNYLMELYPQAQGGRPSGQYIPIPYDRRPALPEPKGRPLPEGASTLGKR
ncbi:hypothetical protein K9N68_11765 [Kovacikia minuta CCNUW1]|uniref:hypothetical protein n=1 Tax=Kovacikia minuta TaxID=2931930 RepID=UPI001CCCE530|nr:hypothetical protein [Kovacikia minuta]UBF28485.1 hypothetical protein K9N68_11765 [Kovacikia minuta CCNUW1]